MTWAISRFGEQRVNPRDLHQEQQYSKNFNLTLLKLNGYPTLIIVRVFKDLWMLVLRLVRWGIKVQADSLAVTLAFPGH